MQKKFQQKIAKKHQGSSKEWRRLSSTLLSVTFHGKEQGKPVIYQRTSGPERPKEIVEAMSKLIKAGVLVPEVVQGEKGVFYSRLGPKRRQMGRALSGNTLSSRIYGYYNAIEKGNKPNTS